MDELDELDDLDAKTDQVRNALEDQGLHTLELSEGIVNVYSQPIGPNGPEPTDANYLFTVTVTVTP